MIMRSQLIKNEITKSLNKNQENQVLYFLIFI